MMSMDKNDSSDSDNTELNSQQKLDKPNMKKQKLQIGLAALLIIFTFAGYLLGTNLTDNNEQQGSNSASGDNLNSESQKQLADTWQAPSSSIKAFPVLEEGKLSIVEPETKEVTTIAEEITYGSSREGFGSADPKPSPDLHFTAYIDKDGNLLVLSHESKESTALTSHGLVSYISDWSPNENIILFAIEQDTIGAQEGIGPASGEFGFNKGPHNGFYVADISTGSVTSLAPLTNVEGDGFIDNSRILTRRNEEEKLVVFDINTFKANFDLVQGTYGFGEGQFEFSRDGSQWAHGRSTNPTNDGSIVVGNFPNEAKTVVVSGSWADYQFPLFSPNGDMLLYTHAPDFRPSTGIPDAKLGLYNIETAVQTVIGDGTPAGWVSDSIVLGYTTDDDGQYSSLFSLNIDTNEKETLFKFSSN